jgi:ribosomal protein L30E
VTDAIALILTALQTGGLFVGKKVAEEAVKDSYAALKRLLMARVRDEDEKEALMPSRDIDLEEWRTRAAEILKRIDAGNDVSLVNAAHELLSQVNQTQNSTGKFNLQAQSVDTVIQGDHSHIVVNRNTPKARQG